MHTRIFAVMHTQTHTLTHTHARIYTRARTEKTKSFFSLSLFRSIFSQCLCFLHKILKYLSYHSRAHAHTRTHISERDQDSSDCKARARARNRAFLPTVLGFHVRNENTEIKWVRIVRENALSLSPPYSISVFAYFANIFVSENEPPRRQDWKDKYSFPNVLFLRPFHLIVQWWKHWLPCHGWEFDTFILKGCSS